MTQRIFDIYNEKDYADLWDILPDWVTTIKKTEKDCIFLISENGIKYGPQHIKINWHDKTEITRPVNYEDMIGCVGWFKHHKETIDECSVFGILDKYNENDNLGRKFYCRSDTWYEYFTPAKKSELKFYGDDE